MTHRRILLATLLAWGLGCAPTLKYAFPAPVEQFGTIVQRLSEAAPAAGWAVDGAPLDRRAPWLELERESEGVVLLTIPGGRPQVSFHLRSRTSDPADRERQLAALKARFDALWSDTVGSLGHLPPKERLPD